ncbi:DNA (cytosine-5-)-methyltransferase [Candidatus Saccharibacteria bacterium]|nr:DNA (cytosine-5-)-methyltransferase [Candidatus Saccharibacteria bacterium]
MSKVEYKILDLFSGCGGFAVGFDMLPEFETLIAVDIMDDALKTFARNFPKAKIINGDICDEAVKRDIIQSAKELKINMIVGGPPCQGFSNKGKKLGLKDPRNFLFREYLKLVDEIKPDVFVIENVKALVATENGWFINEILNEIKKLGYTVNYNIATASNYGVPQQRQRTIILASKDAKIDFPIPKYDEEKKTTVRDAISDLAYLESGEGEIESNYKNTAQSKYQELLRNPSGKLYNHNATNHSEVALSKLKMIPPEGDKKSLPKELLGNQKFNTTWGRLKWDSQSPTIDTRFDTPSNGTNSHPELDRSITPREAARIQSFPDSFKFLGSKTYICKQIGNAVPPLLAKAIGEAVLFGEKKQDYLIYNRDAYRFLRDMASYGFEVDHIITDPPYNISKDNNFSTMKSAKRQGVDFGEWDKEFDLTGWIPDAEKILRPGGTFIIFNSYRNLTPIIEKMESCGLVIKDVIKWIKTNPMPRNIDRRYVQDTEYAIWAVKPKKPWVFNKKADKPYLRAEYRTSTVSGNERTSHPTQKSEKLMSEIIEVHSNKGDLILDPFMGSGTTGVSALSKGRRFIGCELSEEYFDIAKERISNK